jgi:hypothetical protein
MIWKHQKILIWNKKKIKKNINIFENTFKTQKTNITFYNHAFMCVCETINIFNQLLFEGFFKKNKYSVDYFIYLCVNSSNLMIYKSTHLSCNLSPSLVLDQSLYHVFYIYIYITHLFVFVWNNQHIQPIW